MFGIKPEAFPCQSSNCEKLFELKCVVRFFLNREIHKALTCNTKSATEP